MSASHKKQKQPKGIVHFLVGLIKMINIQSLTAMLRTVCIFFIRLIPTILMEIPRIFKRFKNSPNKTSIITSVVLVLSLIICQIVILNSPSQWNKSGTVQDQDIPAYTKTGPEQLQLKEFFIGMDIKDAAEILADDYDEIVANPGKTKIEINEISDGYQIVFPDGVIIANPDGTVTTITFSGFMGATYLGIDVMSPQEFAQSFINRYQIPYLHVEDIDEVYWWTFSSPHGYTVRISQSDGTIVLNMSS